MLCLRKILKKEEMGSITSPNGVFVDMTASCSDCWSSAIDGSPCPEQEFKSIDEGPISLQYSTP